MKGLKLSELYYNEFGASMIKEKFPEYQGRIAAGLVGDGSDCFGFDDEQSQDHDWGPGFCLWLEMDDFKKIGQALSNEYERLPAQYKGFERILSQWGGGRVGVIEIGSFYKKFIGVPHVPQSLESWLYLPENNLAVCTNGKVFTDPLGTFSKIRKSLLEFYPEDVRISLISSRCQSAAQAGQYNYSRSVSHKEYFAARYAEVKFSADIMSLLFLLNKKYAPFYKWRHHALRGLEILGEFMYSKINKLIETNEHKAKMSIIEHISAEVIKELHRQGLSDSKSDFLLDHCPAIHSHIKDEKLKARNVWAG